MATPIDTGTAQKPSVTSRRLTEVTRGWRKGGTYRSVFQAQVTPRAAPPAATHFICWWTAPVELRSRTTTVDPAATMLAASSAQPTTCSASRTPPAPAIPAGFVVEGAVESIAPG